MAPGDAEERRARGGEGLALEVDQLGVAADAALGGRDAVDVADDVDELERARGPERRGLAAAAEVGLRADGDVDAAGDVLEELVDGPAAASR